MTWFYLALVSMVFIVIRNILEKKTLQTDNEIQFLTTFYIFNAILVLPLINKVNFSLTTNEWLLIILIGLLAVVAIYYSVSSIKHFALSFSKPLGSISPILILLLSFFFLKESITLLQLFGVIIIFAVSLLFIKDEAKITHRSIKQLFKSKYVIHLMIALVFGSLAAILDRILLKTVDPTTFLFISRYILLALFLIIVFTKFNGTKDIAKGFKLSAFPILIIALANIALVFFYNSALADPNAKTGLVAIIRSSSLVFTIALSGIVFKEKNIIYKLILSIILIVGLYIILI
ncbi:EamA family transporter [Candidatus Parcubacteria bacterium]|jgi:uncharacterized membrane protein|nr:EamA family transporter [Candidatus Parcubacteria bacterium]